jgi:multiple sugar transport system permease protein
MLLVVVILPAVTTGEYSMTDSRSGDFPTLVNFRSMLSNSAFLVGLSNTFTFVTVSVVFHLLIGLSVAIFLNQQRLPGQLLFRIIAILPWTVPDAVAGIIWRWVLNPSHGALNDLLFRLGAIQKPVEWLGSPSLAMLSVLAANIWRGYPFVMLILLAGLQSIPKERYEAALVDGAGAWQRFRYVTLPGLHKMIIVALALDTIWEVRRFALIKTITDGGPGNATEVLSTLIYKVYFRFFRFEYASAMAVALSLILLAVSLPYIKMVVKED